MQSDVYRGAHVCLPLSDGNEVCGLCWSYLISTLHKLRLNIVDYLKDSLLNTKLVHDMKQHFFDVLNM
jgi:hypothetical protein